LRVVYADGTQTSRTISKCAVHPRLTPALAGLALAAAMSGRRDLPEYHTLDYDLKMEFANGQSVAVADTSVNTPAELWAMQTVLLPAMVAADNPFERVMLKRMSGTIRVTADAREAEVLSVNIPRLKYKPGQKVKAFVTYRPFRAAESILPLEIDLPRDLPDGTYQLVVGDWMRYIMDERSAQPFRFTAENVDDVFAVVKDVMSLRHNALYVRLLRQADGVAVGRVAMARLPVVAPAGDARLRSKQHHAIRQLHRQSGADRAADERLGRFLDRDQQRGARRNRCWREQDSAGEDRFAHTADGDARARCIPASPSRTSPRRSTRRASRRTRTSPTSRVTSRPTNPATRPATKPNDFDETELSHAHSADCSSDRASGDAAARAVAPSHWTHTTEADFKAGTRTKSSQRIWAI
jgi:hypothetical protein